MASDPIVVFAGTTETELVQDTKGSEGYRTIMQRTERRTKTESAVIGSLTLGLLYSNRQISDEAAATMYERNTFKFEGQSTWDALYTFLQMLRVKNKNNLRSLQVYIPIPDKLWRSADGTCTTLEDRWSLRKVVATPTYLQSSPTLSEIPCVSAYAGSDGGGISMEETLGEIRMQATDLYFKH